MTTLILASHMDDEAISCGGLIATRVAQRKRVVVACLFGRVYPGVQTEADSFASESADFHAAREILGYDEFYLYNLTEGEPQTLGYYQLLGKVEGLLQAIAPDEVVIHRRDDRNQDHRWLHDICQIALRPANLGKVRRILGMVPMDGGAPRGPGYFIPLSPERLSLKLRAVAAYRREARQLPHPRAPENITAHHRLMGSACGTEFAEAYEALLIREDHEGLLCRASGT